MAAESAFCVAGSSSRLVVLSDDGSRCDVVDASGGDWSSSVIGEMGTVKSLPKNVGVDAISFMGGRGVLNSCPPKKIKQS